MTRYYNVQRVKEQGVLLQRIGDSQPRFNGRLAVVLDNGMHQAAPDVTDPVEYQYHYRNYFGGSWLSFTVYGLPAGFGGDGRE